MAKLTAQARKKLPGRVFAVDGKKRKYPIHDVSHARNALSRVSQHGTPAEKASVRAAVRSRFPAVGGNRQSHSERVKATLRKIDKRRGRK